MVNWLFLTPGFVCLTKEERRMERYHTKHWEKKPKAAEKASLFCWSITVGQSKTQINPCSPEAMRGFPWAFGIKLLALDSKGLFLTFYFFPQIRCIILALKAGRGHNFSRVLLMFCAQYPHLVFTAGDFSLGSQSGWSWGNALVPPKAGCSGSLQPGLQGLPAQGHNIFKISSVQQQNEVKQIFFLYSAWAPQGVTYICTCLFVELQTFAHIP